MQTRGRGRAAEPSVGRRPRPDPSKQRRKSVAAREPSAVDDSIYARIYAVVAMIPEGRVATYGQVAELAGLPGYARQVGYALAASSGPELPWHRVINARGRISPRGAADADRRQRILLEDEGVQFDSSGRVALRRFRWRPGLDEPGEPSGAGGPSDPDGPSDPCDRGVPSDLGGRRNTDGPDARTMEGGS